MMPQEFCQPQHGERVKALAHGSMLVLAGVFVAYNTLAICVRAKAERHLVRNVTLYTLLMVIEWHHVQRHRRNGW